MENLVRKNTTYIAVVPINEDHRSTYVHNIDIPAAIQDIYLHNFR